MSHEPFSDARSGSEARCPSERPTPDQEPSDQQYFDEIAELLDRAATTDPAPAWRSWRTWAADVIELGACWLFVKGADLAARVRGG